MEIINQNWVQSSYLESIVEWLLSYYCKSVPFVMVVNHKIVDCLATLKMFGKLWPKNIIAITIWIEYFNTKSWSTFWLNESSFFSLEISALKRGGLFCQFTDNFVILAKKSHFKLWETIEVFTSWQIESFEIIKFLVHWSFHQIWLGIPR